MRKGTVKLLLSLLMCFAISFVFAQTGPAGAGAGTKSAPEAATKETAPAKGASAEGGPSSTQLNPSEEYSEADRPEENYLAKFHALDRVQILMKYNLEQIYILNIITQNFNKDHADWNEEYKKVYEGYKKGLDLYYRRNIIYSRVKLEENKKHINEFYKKISDVYNDDTLAMLNICASAILEQDLKAETSLNPNSSRKLFQQKMRLRVAYGQLDDAERARMDRLYGVSIFHYRVAKTYAISIMEDLDPEKYTNKYDVHKADNLNRIMNDKVTKATEVVDKKTDTVKENKENSDVKPELK